MERGAAGAHLHLRGEEVHQPLLAGRTPRQVTNATCHLDFIHLFKCVIPNTCLLARLGTHVVSTIINLGQEVEEDWVLYIKDHKGNTHQVT